MDLRGKANYHVDGPQGVDFTANQVEEQPEIVKPDSPSRHEGAHGTLVDGSCILFYGIITLPGRVRDQVIHETFIVSHLKKDAILGMPFLEKHQCHMDFQKLGVVMAGKELACVDKFVRPLVGGVQVVQDCMILERSQATLRCRVNCKEIADLGVVEETHKVI